MEVNAKMKLKLFSVALVLLLVSITLSPSAVLAKTKKASFTGGGALIVTQVLSTIKYGDTIRFEGEVAESPSISSDWLLIYGTSFYSVHHSEVKVDKKGNVKGNMEGIFQIKAQDGSILEGTFTGKITGSFDPTMTFFDKISDEGEWKSTNGTGVFEGAEAEGTWSANLVPYLNTLAGPFSWDGKYELN
jgi:hypothetical protein